MAARNPGPALFGALLGALLLGAFAMALRQRGAALYGLSRGRPGAHSFKYRMECVSQPAAGERYDAGGRVGFVFSATERYAQGMAYRCVAAIESLVRVGGWSGPVYLMASKGEACLDEAHLREVTGSPNVYVVHDFYAALRGMPGVFPGLPRAFDCGAAKAVKGAMLDIVGRLHSAAGIGGRAAPGAPPDVLIYHDCDKVVAKPGCIAEMLRAPLAFGADRRFYVSHMEPRCARANNETGPCGDGLHTGVVAAHRRWSAPLARAWALAQLRNGKQYDRHTLWATWNRSRAHDGSTDLPITSLPPAYQDSMWNFKLPPACINHVSGGRCKAAGQKRARAFMRSLCLRARPHAACPHQGSVEEWCGWDSPS